MLRRTRRYLSMLRRSRHYLSMFWYYFWHWHGSNFRRKHGSNFRRRKRGSKLWRRHGSKFGQKRLNISKTVTVKQSRFRSVLSSKNSNFDPNCRRISKIWSMLSSKLSPKSLLIAKRQNWRISRTNWKSIILSNSEIRSGVEKLSATGVTNHAIPELELHSTQGDSPVLKLLNWFAQNAVADPG